MEQGSGVGRSFVYKDAGEPEGGRGRTIPTHHSKTTHQSTTQQQFFYFYLKQTLLRKQITKKTHLKQKHSTNPSKWVASCLVSAPSSRQSATPSWPSLAASATSSTPSSAPSSASAESLSASLPAATAVAAPDELVDVLVDICGRRGSRFRL